MANNDGKVIINIDSNAQKVARDFNTLDVAIKKSEGDTKKGIISFNQLNTTVSTASERLRTLALQGRQNSKEFQNLASVVRSANKQLNSADNVVNKAIGNTQGLASSFFNLNTALGALSIGYITNKIIDLGKSAVDTSMDFQALENRMNAAAGNKSVGFDSLDYIREQADKLGLEFRTTADSFAGFEAAALRSGLTLEQTKQIFTDVSTAATSMQLSTERVQLVFKALEQISGKGTVSMEELRQQLGDSLPGAFEIAAQSMGMTTRAFYDAVANGEVLSSEFLPKFAKAIKEQLGGSAEEASTQLRASLNRLNTDLMDSSNAWGTLLQPAAQKGVEAYREAIQASTELANTLNQNQAQIGAVATSVGTATTAFIALRAAAGVQLTTTLASLSTSLTAVGTASKAMWAAITANPYLTAAAVIAAGIGGITYALQQNQVELSKEAQKLKLLANEVSNNAIETPRLIAEYHNLATATNRTGEQEQRLIEIKDKLNAQYPGLLDKYGKELTAHSQLSNSISDVIAKYIKLAEVQRIVAQQQVAESKYNEQIENKWYSVGAFERGRKIKAMNEYTEATNASTSALRKLLSQEKTGAKVIQGSHGYNDYTLGVGTGGLGSDDKDKKGREKRQLTISEQLQNSYNDEFKALQDLAAQGITSGKVWDSQVSKVNNLSAALERVKQATDLTVLPPFQALNTEIQKAQERVNNLAASKIVNLAELKQAKTDLTALEKKMYDIQQAAETSPYQKKQNELGRLRSQYLDLFIQGQGNSAAAISIKNTMKQVENEITRANTAVSNSVGLTWNNISSTISSQLSYALTTPLQEGENAFERLGNVALNVIQQIAQAWLSSKLTNLFSANSGSKKGGGLFGTIGGLFGSLWGPAGSVAGGVAGGAFDKVVASANGNVFRNGNVIPFAKGGVVSSPSMFPMTGNRTGLMGERGAEAIMPLKRTANGELGVQAQTAPANVNIYNQSDSRIETVQRPNGDTDIFIKRINNALRSERTQSGFSSALQRNQSRGVQAS